MSKQTTPEGSELRQTPWNDPYYDRLRLFLDATQAETDRGQVLIAASLIDQMLGQILKSYLLDNQQTKDLFNAPNAPLSSFSAKALLCSSLSFISVEEFRDVNIIRRVRNDFAHNIECSFASPKIASLSSSLKYGMSALDALPEGHKSKVIDPKGRFGMVAASLVTGLYDRAPYVKKLQIQEMCFPL